MNREQRPKKPRKKAKTIRQRIDEAEKTAQEGNTDLSIRRLSELLKEEHGMPTVPEAVEIVDLIASLKKTEKLQQRKSGR